MKKLFKRSSFACLYANYILFDKFSVVLGERHLMRACSFFSSVFKTTQVALLFCDFLVVIVQ